MLKDQFIQILKLIPDTYGQVVSEAAIAMCFWKWLSLNYINTEKYNLMGEMENFA